MRQDIGLFHGELKIIISELCLKDTEERLFPASKNRSARIRKKLVKRFGGEFRKEPCIYQTPQGIIMHPSLKAALDLRLTVLP